VLDAAVADHLRAHPHPAQVGEAARRLPVLDRADDAHIVELAWLGVVVHRRLRHNRVPQLVVELGHQVRVALVQVDGPRVHALRRSGGAQLFDHLIGVARIEHREPVALGIAQVDVLRRIVAPGVDPFLAAVAERVILFQLHHGIDKAGAEQRLIVLPALVRAQRRLVRGARQVPLQDVDVVGVEQCILVRLAQEHIRVAHVVLVQRVVQADEHRERGV